VYKSLMLELPGWNDYNIAGGMKKIGSVRMHEGGDPTLREPPARLSLQLRFINV
jgi:hypothetical protein